MAKALPRAALLPEGVGDGFEAERVAWGGLLAGPVVRPGVSCVPAPRLSPEACGEAARFMDFLNVVSISWLRPFSCASKTEGAALGVAASLALPLELRAAGMPGGTGVALERAALGKAGDVASCGRLAPFKQGAPGAGTVSPGAWEGSGSSSSCKARRSSRRASPSAGEARGEAGGVDPQVDSG